MEPGQAERWCLFLNLSHDIKERGAKLARQYDTTTNSNEKRLIEVANDHILHAVAIIDELADREHRKGA